MEIAVENGENKKIEIEKKKFVLEDF